MITGGGADLKYTLTAEVGNYQKVLKEMMGNESDFSMGIYKNYTVYRLTASYPDGACSKMISAAIVRERSTPTLLDIVGADVCKKLNGDVAEGEIKLCLPSKERIIISVRMICNIRWMVLS